MKKYRNAQGRYNAFRQAGFTLYEKLKHIKRSCYNMSKRTGSLSINSENISPYYQKMAVFRP